jgi:hypothetical protein
MKRIKIIKQGIVTNQAEGIDAEVDVWLASCLSKNTFGKPERWIDESIATDEEKAAKLDTRVIEGDFPRVEIKLPAEYTINVEDMTAEISAKQSRIDILRALIIQVRDFDIDGATTAQLKNYLKLQRSAFLKVTKILKDSLESQE